MSRTASEQAEQVMADQDVPEDPQDEETDEIDVHPDRTREMSASGLSRMRTGWAGDDDQVIMEQEALAMKIVRDRFPAAFGVMRKIYKSVRTPLCDPKSGEVFTYADGTPRWEKDEDGMEVEDWENLDDKTRDDLLHVIDTHMFEWELAAASIHADAMNAKAAWQEVFSRAFTAVPSQQVSGKPTIQDKEHWAVKNAAQERYFALFRSSLSRRADGIVRAMTRLSYRLDKDLSR